MKALQLTEPKHFEFIDVPEPTPSPDEALVRVHSVGICGSDASGYLGKMPFFKYPVIPGHELGVEVVEVGSNVTNVKAGDRCSVEPYINNPDSFASQRGKPNCCEDLQVLGIHTNGGLKPYFNVPARKLHPGGNLAYDQLALVETLAIGCHAIDRAGAQEGENMLVIGAGPIGLTAIEFLRLAKSKITIMDINKPRLEFCKTTMGVDHTIAFKDADSALEAIKEITDGNLFTLVIDATGNHHSMASALNYCAHTGRLVFVGVTGEEIHFRPSIMHRKELTLFSSRNALPKDFTRITKLIEDGKIDTSVWITHRTQFENTIEDFPKLIAPETGVIKAVIEIK